MLLLMMVLATVLLLWCGLGVFAFWSLRGGTVLRLGQAADPPSRLPKVSILVPARNEEESLAAALESLLKLDYPDYEVIVVDDASTDRTGQIAEEWARQFKGSGRLRVIHNRDLPPGWRGKVHALSLAARAANSEWILATDADVVFHPAVLRLAMACALGRDAHLFSVAPEFECGSFWEKVVLPAFSLLLLTLFPLRAINNPKSPCALAAGAFILMRRDELEALGGYERLRQVVVEDLRLAEMFKRSGRRIHLATTRGLLRTRMYRGWREVWQGLGRSAFEGVGFSLARVLAGVFLGTILGVLPWLAAAALCIRDAQLGLSLMEDVALVLALATCVVSGGVYLPFLRFLRVSPIYVLTLPLATVFYSGVALNSAWASLLGRGIPWKGRHYPPPA